MSVREGMFIISPKTGPGMNVTHHLMTNKSHMKYAEARLTTVYV